MAANKDQSDIWGYSILVGIFLLCWAFNWIPFQSKAVVYNVFCSTELNEGVCTGEETTSVTTLYRADKDTNSVTYWVDGYSPSKYADCAIVDFENWSCHEKPSTFSPSTVQMVGGTLATSYFDDIAPTKVGVSKWHWWGLKIPEYFDSIGKRKKK